MLGRVPTVSYPVGILSFKKRKTPQENEQNYGVFMYPRKEGITISYHNLVVVVFESKLVGSARCVVPLSNVFKTS